MIGIPSSKMEISWEFRSILNAELRVWLDEFFESKPGDFYKRGIENLVERWEEVVNNKGKYIID